MIPDACEFLSSLYGAWRLVRLDPAGMAYFNLSADGFWRSFFAAPLILPFYLLLVWLDAPRAGALGLDLLRYGLGWLVFPLVMFAVARLLDRSGRYVGLVVAMNWTAVPQWALVMAAFPVSRLLPDPAAAFINLAVLSLLLFYDYFVARVALAIGVGQAVAVAAIGFLVALLLDSAVLGPA